MPGVVCGGFTLVEILIVVIILGILAAIVLPAFTNATTEAKENMLKEDIRIIRTQINSYQIQHRDTPPGYPPDGGAPTAAVFEQQMTSYTDEYGHTNAVKTAVFRYGPYMRSIPTNSVNGMNDITIIADGQPLPAAPPAEGGWIYKPEDVRWFAAALGNDSNNTPYYSY